MRRLTTQIGSTPRPRKTILTSVRNELTKLDIKVTHPGDEPRSDKNQWTEYESELAFFEAIAHSTFHIIWNEGGEITKQLSLQIAYALSKKRPVVLLKNPLFAPEVDTFLRETISKRTARFTIANLAKMEPAELNFMLKKLPEETDYELSSHEAILINSRIKAHFRSLLAAAQNETKC